MIDISTIRPGDEVTIRAKVTNTSPFSPLATRSIEVTVSGNHHGWILNDEIATHTPKALAVGDEAAVAGFSHRVAILAISGKRAWVKRLDSIEADYLCNLDTLERRP